MPATCLSELPDLLIRQLCPAADCKGHFEAGKLYLSLASTSQQLSSVGIINKWISGGLLPSLCLSLSLSLPYKVLEALLPGWYVVRSM